MPQSVQDWQWVPAAAEESHHLRCLFYGQRLPPEHMPLLLPHLPLAQQARQLSLRILFHPSLISFPLTLLLPPLHPSACSIPYFSSLYCITLIVFLPPTLALPVRSIVRRPVDGDDNNAW
ncbi:hypothetical protein IWX49DRAFT_275596 [Phyllosticta citricarpa]|uniref:Uncharacterized protein n=2 Tax=Phyllosticta TaxID=121621 RepID=A0ABR1MML5_9PEZI